MSSLRLFSLRTARKNALNYSLRRSRSNHLDSPVPCAAGSHDWLMSVRKSRKLHTFVSSADEQKAACPHNGLRVRCITPTDWKSFVPPKPSHHHSKRMGKRAWRASRVLRVLRVPCASGAKRASVLCKQPNEIRTIPPPRCRAIGRR